MKLPKLNEQSGLGITEEYKFNKNEINHITCLTDL